MRDKFDELAVDEESTPVSDSIRKLREVHASKLVPKIQETKVSTALVVEELPERENISMSHQEDETPTQPQEKQVTEPIDPRNRARPVSEQKRRSCPTL